MALPLKISLVNSKEQFNVLFGAFRDSARIRTTPDMFLIGLDIEYICQANNPRSFSRCLSWVKKADKIAVCKLQMATESQVIVIDLCKFGADLPDSLRKILTCDSWIKTGVGISSDLSYLSYNFDLGHCNGGIDLKLIAQLIGCRTPNLFDLYQSTTDKKYIDFVEKHKKKSGLNGRIDWSMEITAEQIDYCVMDAVMSYKVGRFFVDGIRTAPQLASMNFTFLMVPTIAAPAVAAAIAASTSGDVPLVFVSDKPPSPSVEAPFVFVSAPAAATAVPSPPVENSLVFVGVPPSLPLTDVPLIIESKGSAAPPTAPMIANPNLNYIGTLQEIGQRHAYPLPQYTDLMYGGGPYSFAVKCEFMGKETNGYGKTKKAAKTDAAMNMLNKLSIR
ncbi:MAG: double-stranded RNA binding motif-containing protein [Hyperionvirus sp.]|uniref:Double-stranded RNA binding motif-containing protein n=1 Tax=Hyperionvirus sp. TaxID=2487770 RepID=A0A3G5A7Y2_9VIRU|nr:MAG: double-stranded RNA binding motif-containing protein [Hyperionvirus sp.]